jgi:hypothetical protein
MSDRSGGEIKIPGRPWHFADQVAADEDQLAARQGEHNAEVLKELGFGAAEIAALETSGALVQPSSNSTASDSLLPANDIDQLTSWPGRGSPSAAGTPFSFLGLGLSVIALKQETGLRGFARIPGVRGERRSSREGWEANGAANRCRRP